MFIFILLSVLIRDRICLSFSWEPLVKRQLLSNTCNVHAIKNMYSVFLQDTLLIEWKISRGDYFSILYQNWLLRNTISFSFQGKYSVKFGYYVLWCNFSGVKDQSFGPSCVDCHTDWQKQSNPALMTIMWPSASHCIFIGWQKTYRQADLLAKWNFKQSGIIALDFRIFEEGEVAMSSRYVCSLKD